MESETPKPSPSSGTISVDPGLRETWMGVTKKRSRASAYFTQRNTDSSAAAVQLTRKHSKAAESLTASKSIISAYVTLRRPNGWKSITHRFRSRRTKNSERLRSAGVMLSLRRFSKMVLMDAIACPPTCAQTTPMLRKLI